MQRAERESGKQSPFSDFTFSPLQGEIGVQDVADAAAGLQGVGDRALKKNIPVTALCGGLGDGSEQIYEHGIDSIMTTVDGPMELSEALDRAEDLYYKGAVRLFRMVRAGMRMK